MCASLSWRMTSRTACWWIAEQTAPLKFSRLPQRNWLGRYGRPGTAGADNCRAQRNLSLLVLVAFEA